VTRTNRKAAVLELRRGSDEPEVAMSRVLIAWIGAVLALVVACGADKPAQTAAAPTAPAEPAVPAGGGAASTSEMCAFVYSLDTLGDREFAFDGTLSKITPGDAPTETTDGTPDKVTFAVAEWFKGGSGDEITLIGTGFGEGEATPGETAGGSVGDRMLVAGDEGNVWGCGFTQPYDAKVAADWETTLKG
jgi:hypothetical protein